MPQNLNTMIYKYFLPILLVSISIIAQAREGMWIPMLLDKNIAEMQQMGFKLTSEDIYSINNASMKDAIVQFGGGCTGELISNDGLLITNYHCGYSDIQSHSSLEHDYLTDGFWAKNRNEELPNEGLTVTFLVRMEEVTSQVLQGTDTLKTKEGIEIQKKNNINSLISTAEKDTGYDASVKPFYFGNQFFLFVTETFKDVRLVGAPPSAIGKFGGDTDNWMWPRHTGDFSMFRIYADKDNKPAEYSPENVPYHPKKFFSINIKGVKENDFTMVFGFPGTTEQFLPSQAVDQIMNQSDPDRVAIRDIKLSIMAKAMDEDPAIRIKYSAKYASTSNGWKKWQGEILGLKRLDAIRVKQFKESEFANWVNMNNERKEKYGNILETFDTLYSAFDPYKKAFDYYVEVVYRGTDVYKMFSLVKSHQKGESLNTKEELVGLIGKHFKDYDKEVDKDIFIQLITKYKNDLQPEFIPNELSKVFSEKDPQQTLAKMYEKSFLTKPDKLQALTCDSTNSKWCKSASKDGLYKLLEAMTNSYSSNISIEYFRIKELIDENQKNYMAALLEMNSNKLLFPDANSTLRVSYGKVEGYNARDGVEYNYFTTLEGIIEKDNPQIYDYRVPERMKELFARKDYGRYAQSNGTMPVCFTASNHTTGGNSGSPVIDANGYLIGINFDRCWEGTMSDIMFDPEKCRNIALDMRYMLFVIDKFAQAGYLLNEMKIIE
jgi:hypothetical protein